MAIFLPTEVLYFPEARPKSQEVLPLFIIRSLILHPIPELDHAPNLLSIIIWHWIRVRLTRRVNAILLNAAVKIFIFLYVCVEQGPHQSAIYPSQDLEPDPDPTPKPKKRKENRAREQRGEGGLTNSSNLRSQFSMREPKDCIPYKGA